MQTYRLAGTRQFTTLAIVAMLVLALAAFAAPPALADSGDGSEACNYGEICLFEDAQSTQLTKHYWYSAIYTSSHRWWNTVGNYYTGYVDDDMEKARNRDSSCWVTFKDYGTGATWSIPNNGSYYTNSQFANKADRHDRELCS